MRYADLKIGDLKNNQPKETGEEIINRICKKIEGLK